MQEITVDYSTKIQYITDTTNLTIKYGNYDIFPSSPMCYTRLFNFLNYDLLSFSNDLIDFYAIKSDDISEFISEFTKIALHLKKILGVSHLPAIISFIQSDYTQYVKNKYIFSYSISEQETIKNEYFRFLSTLYMLSPKPHDTYILGSFDVFADTYTQNYFKVLFDTQVTPFKPTLPITQDMTEDQKPHYNNLYTIQKKFHLYLSLNMSSTESYRLQRTDLQTRIEFQNLIASVQNKSPKDYTFSEKIAQQIYNSKKSQEKYCVMYPKSNTAPHPSIPPYPLLDNAEIILDLEYLPQNAKEVAYICRHIEDILLLDMFHFIRSGHYTFQCPSCNQMHENNRLQFYCCDSCKNKHREYIKFSCAPWKEYEIIRKKIMARKRRGTYTQKQYTNYNSIFTEILDTFLQGKIGSLDTLQLLSDANAKMDGEFQKLRYDKYCG